MKKQKVIYRYFRYDGKVLHARREISFEIKLSSRLLLDELCFNWNKHMLNKDVDHFIDTGDKEQFKQLSETYGRYFME